MIPVYMINGFLESGKTEFIKDLISGNDGVVSSKLDSAGTYEVVPVLTKTPSIYKFKFVPS